MAQDGQVTGIGGVFFRSPDPERFAAWYRQHLGFVVTAAGGPDPDGNWVWAQQGGDTVYSAFPPTSDYWPADRAVMINLRVAGLDALAGRLEAAGIAVSQRLAMEGVGQFARIHDCDGNPIELWEPQAAG